MNPKIQFGSGGTSIEGWISTDLPGVDITKPLPYADGSVHAVFASHLVEHITHQQAWNFFDECYRILEPGGLIRITVPDFTRIANRIDKEYCDFVKSRGWSDGSVKNTLRSMIFLHDHQAMWTTTLLQAFLGAIGFSNPHPRNSGVSAFSDLTGLENHHRAIGEYADNVESISVEGQKCLT